MMEFVIFPLEKSMSIASEDVLNTLILLILNLEFTILIASSEVVLSIVRSSIVVLLLYIFIDPLKLSIPSLRLVALRII
jgi:hypothetical protein